MQGSGSALFRLLGICQTSPIENSLKSELKQALGIAAAVTVAVGILVNIRFDLPYIGHVGSAVIAVLFLYTPVWFAERQGHDLRIYGFRIDPLGRGLGLGVGYCLIVVPLFGVGFILFYHLICDIEVLRPIAPAGLCNKFSGWDQITVPDLSLFCRRIDSPAGSAVWGCFAKYVAIQLVVVALCEEFFYRGLLLQLLEKALPPTRRILGGGIGWALVISAILFAVVHLPKGWDPRSLGTFFPGLMFGWMRSATGSILPGTIAHAASNIAIGLLNGMVF